jgi:hypothetical protein
MRCWCAGAAAAAPALGRLIGCVEIRAVLQPVVPIEFFLGSCWEYIILCIITLKLQYLIGHCVGLIGVIAGAEIVCSESLECIADLKKKVG